MKVVRKVNHEKGVEVIETSIPTPKNDEVLIKIEAVSICGSDVHMYEGEKGSLRGLDLCWSLTGEQL